MRHQGVAEEEEDEEEEEGEESVEVLREEEDEEEEVDMGETESGAAEGEGSEDEAPVTPVVQHAKMQRDIQRKEDELKQVEIEGGGKFERIRLRTIPSLAPLSQLCFFFVALPLVASSSPCYQCVCLDSFLQPIPFLPFPSNLLPCFTSHVSARLCAIAPFPFSRLSRVQVLCCFALRLHLLSPCFECSVSRFFPVLFLLSLYIRCVAYLPCLRTALRYSFLPSLDPETNAFVVCARSCQHRQEAQRKPNEA